jgi:hypothetical protein
VTKPFIDCGSEPETIRAVGARIEAGSLPHVYVRSGALVHLSKVTGDIDAAPGGPGETPPLPIAASALTPAGLARLLADHTFCHRSRSRRDRAGEITDTWEEEVSPSPRALAAVLSRRNWRGLRVLRGIVGSPVLRPDGTLLQAAGYDAATGLYLAPRVEIPPIPDEPTVDEVLTARSFVLGELLANFPFVAKADLANYVGLLVTQILRPYLRTLTPFGLLSATTQSSGKTLLADVIGALYGQKRLVWRRGDDAELEKGITAALRDPAAVLVWDNLAEGSVVASPVLAQLLTSPTWSGRVLGTNTTFDAANDRMWLATGNNIRLGGDMATRTVLVRLDPDDPHPEERDQDSFGIPHLDAWIRTPANRVTVLRHLLVLVVDWMAAGAPRSAHTMRQFSGWAAAAGGFLTHHGVDGFLQNVAEVREADEENAEWVAFLTRWFGIFQTRKVSVREVRQSAEFGATADGRPMDLWHGAFLTDDNGRVPSAKSLGRSLTGHVGRWHGPFVLRSQVNTATNARDYWVESKP